MPGLSFFDKTMQNLFGRITLIKFGYSTLTIIESIVDVNT